MFQKPFRIKSNSQMKHSERKSLKAQILQHFSNLAEKDVDTIFPNKEIISVVKATTHSDFVITIYLVQKRPMIFEHQNHMYPTVYFLWNLPDTLLTFTTPTPVLQKIVSGADLMLPGVVVKEKLNGPNKYGRFEKGTMVAVNLVNNRAPIAVGTTAHSSMDMYMTAGRGKCVNILHCLGDKLCSMDGCQTLACPELGPPDWLINDSDEENDTNVTLSENNDKSIEEHDHMTEHTITNEVPETLNNDDTTIQSSLNQNEDIDNSGTKSLNPVEEMDDLFIYCLLKVIRYSGKKLALPLLTSNFFRLHLTEVCPDGEKLDIKKSSFKKFSKFMKKMAEEKLITVVEYPKGVENITDINLAHEKVKSFSLKESDVFRTQVIIDQKLNSPDVSETYRVTAAVLPLFKEAGFRKGDALSVTEARKHITNYVKKYNLQNDDRFIEPNQVLATIINSNLPQTWEDIMDKMIRAMGSCYKVTSVGHQVEGKGKLEPINISVGTRSGNKKVTLIDNLELYGIKLAEFAKECQHGVGASTSISKPPGKKREQLLIQGNQVLFLGNILMGKYKIAKRYIRGLELAPKK